MAEILAENLSGMSVMGSDGSQLGMLYNISMDLDSGRLIHLLVTPGDEAPAAGDLETDEAGRLKVPVRHVQAVKDYIIVER